jgi:hypothetical protein
MQQLEIFLDLCVKALHEIQIVTFQFFLGILPDVCSILPDVEA